MTKKRLFIALLLLSTVIIVLFSKETQPVSALNNGLATTPPMGWNSYDSFNWSVTEAEVKANADYMAANLRSVGWQYIIVDWCWSYPGTGNSPTPNQTNLTPRLRMDANGRLLPDTGRFPSATGTNGFKPLADYVHSKGLKFGIHMMRGIPRQAVADNTPILGTSYRAGDVENTTTAAWLNHMWGLNMSHPGAQAYLNSLFQMYASWGVDYVKVDDIAAPTYYNAEVEGYKNAIANSGRPMVLSLSPGPTALSSGPHVQQNANMWRIVNDLWDNWPALDAEFDKLRDWTAYRIPGAWPDPDMIPIGRLALRGPVGSPRYSSFTTDEKRTLMSLWVISRSPLMWGGNMVENTAADLALMNNAAVMAVNQNSSNNRELSATSTTRVWVADVPNTTDKYIALFNRGSATASVSVALSSIGMSAATVTDLWSGANLGTFNTTFSRSIPAHGAGLYRLVRQGSAVPTNTPGSSGISTGVNYNIINQNSNKCVDDYNFGTTNGSRVVQWACTGTQTNQQWQFQSTTNGYYRIVSVFAPSMVIDVNGGATATADGAIVQLWANNGGTNQQWLPESLGNGYFRFRARHSNKCLDVPNASTTDGIQLQQWTCNGNAAQAFRLVQR